MQTVTSPSSRPDTNEDPEPWENTFWVLWTSRRGRKKVIVDVPPHYRQDDVIYLADLIDSGKYRAFIDRRYPLNEVVAAARYVETEQKTGNVVLIVDGV